MSNTKMHDPLRATLPWERVMGGCDLCDPHRAAALKHVNDVLTYFGVAPVSRLLPGRRNTSNGCAIAVTLSAAFDGEVYVYVRDRTVLKTRSGDLIGSFEHRRPVDAFIRLFDHAHWHDLLA